MPEEYIIAKANRYGETITRLIHSISPKSKTKKRREVKSMTKKYRAVLISPDGEDWVSDYQGDSINDVWEKVSNRGSTWFFYPIAFVIHEPGIWFGPLRRIVDAPEGLEHLIGKSIRTTMRWIKNNSEFIQASLS